MAAELSPRIQHIAEIFDSSKPVASSKLVYLSDLSSEELKFLGEIWVNADAARRHQVISQLVHLSEVDFRLDFNGVFVFCLGDPDEAIRIQATTGLDGEENYLLITPLLRALKEDNSTEVRAAAAVAIGKFVLLGELGKLPTHYKNKIYTALLEVLENKVEAAGVRRRALEAVSPFNLPRVKELIEQAYHTDDVKLKASAIYAMGRNCDFAWLTTLVTELNSNEAEIRYEAANACGELGAEEAVPHLLKLIKDEDRQVQEAAIEALGQIGGEQATQALNKLVKNPQPRISQAAKSALEEIHFCEDPLFFQPQLGRHC
ncbi:MAG: HEAT repeat domain-containing protein [Chloroflexi bacterium]|nr:HEAT repeat domain-containing protein [Chloroflexota bacterium]MBL7061541.1 HEAT repeat domain-containing protein [Dehalococcoidia bacterium]